MPIFAVSLKRCYCYQHKLWVYSTECYQNCTQCREIHAIKPFEIGIAIFQFVLQWQRDKGDWSVKYTDFLKLKLVAMATSLEIG